MANPEQPSAAYALKSQPQPSFRRRVWTWTAILSVVMIFVLALVGLTAVPLVLNLSGPTATSDGLVVTGIGGIVVGLIGLGMAPRRASTVYLDRAGLYKRPSLSGGVIALSILFAGLAVLAIGAIMSSM